MQNHMTFSCKTLSKTLGWKIRWNTPLHFVVSACGVLLLAAGLASVLAPQLAIAQNTVNPATPAAPTTSSTAPAVSTTSVSMDALMAQGALPDVPIGSPTATVTIVEYASMTCTHCAAFHATTWPQLRAKYIDTGKVRFILREFPLDPLATAGFMLGRCQGVDKRNAMLDFLFDQQKNWAFVERPIEALVTLVKQAGMTQQDFENCLKNQELLNQVAQMREVAADKFRVDATPTFFVNGTRLSGEASLEEFDKLIEPLLKNQ